MAPTQIGSLLRQVIYYHLDNGSYDSALFFAERFAAQERSSDSASLFSLCHLRLGDYRSAYDISKSMANRGNLACAWIFAQACLALERYKEGIAALEKSRTSWIQRNLLGKHSATSRPTLPDGPAVLCLLGKLYRGYDEQTKSITCFEDALKMNPFQWDAFKALCDMGVKLRVPNIFKLSEGLIHCLNQDAPPAAVSGSQNTIPVPFELSHKRPPQRTAGPDAGIDPFSAGLSSSDLTPLGESFGANATTENEFMTKMQISRAKLANSMPSHAEMDAMGTPTGPFLVDPHGSRSIVHQEPPQAPSRRTRNAQAVDSSVEAPPRINPRLAARRGMLTRDKTQEQPAEHIPDHADALNSYSRSGTIAPSERKRTLSGHPAQRVPNHEELGTRRSARLTRPATRANTTIGNIGPPAPPRELKKARPPISRANRPASGTSSVGRLVSGNRKPLEDLPMDEQYEVPKMTVVPPPPPVAPVAPKPVEAEMSKFEEALRWIMDLLKKLGTGYHFMSHFQCQDAVQALSALPSAHQGSPWVLALMGRAHYELAQYVEAEKFFRRMRVQAPSRVEDMEVYSTTLWHLKRETDLSYLAHELVDSSWHSPQAWCALGNAWSLERDPEQALRCFKRATQLDPKFAYGFTLQGHEFVANEEYGKALTAYRQAIAADKRHYNAYYGIGRVQQRMGAFDKALSHFQAASVINPNNAVLVCCIGTALEKQKQILPALRAYTKAVELAPRAASTRYKKARALLAAGQIEEAQQELLILKDLAPDEATVHFLLATLYRSTKQRQLAVNHFTIALALDPKAGSQVKEAIETFEDDVLMDDGLGSL